MSIIEYNNDEFAVVKTKDFGEKYGTYRMIRYDTGYYALQYETILEVEDNEPVPVWATICISPEKDDPLTPNRVWNLCAGKLGMESIFLALEDSNKLHNNELMELHLHLNPTLDDDVEDTIVKLVKTSEGDNIYDAVMESIRIQNEYVTEYYAHEDKISNIYLIFIALLILCLIFNILRLVGLM